MHSVHVFVIDQVRVVVDLGLGNLGTVVKRRNMTDALLDGSPIVYI